MEAYMEKVKAEAAHHAAVEAGIAFGAQPVAGDFTENVSAWNAVVEEVVARSPEAWAEAIEPENYMSPLYPDGAPWVFVWYHARPVVRIALDMTTRALSYAVARRGHFYQDGGGNWRCTDWIEVPDLAEAELELGRLAPDLGSAE